MYDFLSKLDVSFELEVAPWEVLCLGVGRDAQGRRLPTGLSREPLEQFFRDEGHEGAK